MARRGPQRLRLAVSSCLLGEAVRYDGGHKRDSLVIELFGRHFDLVPLCPEVGIGLGVPREPIRLMGPVARPRAVGARTPELDVTRALSVYGRRAALALDRAGVCGYIFKSRSPSCGLRAVVVHRRGRRAARRGTGIYARALLERLPLLPAEDEERLRDPALRENFVERVHAYGRWQALAATGLLRPRLVKFHAAHRLTLMARGGKAFDVLERMLADRAEGGGGALGARYVRRFMQALARPAPRRGHLRVMRHLLGRLKHCLDREDWTELAEIVRCYGDGRLPRIVPITLLRHHLRRTRDPDADQVYLNPDAREVMMWML